MAGIPARVLHRAATILADLEATEASPKPPPMAVVPMQLQLFEAEPPPVMAELTCLDVNQLTPLEALRVLDDWKRRFST
jgi:DNA mismatch repair protein MutS